MKRPEKQKPKNSELGGEILCKGYNIACDDWEEFLPSNDDIADIVTESLDEYFPKGKCKERGKALVLVADIIIKMVKRLKGDK